MDRRVGSKPLVLVAEPEELLAARLRDHLESQGFRIAEAIDGEAALARFGEARPDLVLLDWTLPVTSGVEVCRHIRRGATHFLPVILLSARSDHRDQVEALNAGADDYIIKPISLDVLLARIRALLRRAGTLSARGQRIFHDLTMDFDAHRVRRNGRALHLGPCEFRLLKFLLEHPGQVFSRQELRDALWRLDADVGLRTVDVLIRRLRQATEVPGGRNVVRTVRSAGYALDMERI